MLLHHDLSAMRLGVHPSWRPPADIPFRVGGVAPVADAYTRIEAVPRISGQNNILSDCVPTACANAVQTRMGRDGIFDAVIPNGDVISAYSAVTGYDPAHPATDRGTHPDAMFAWWKTNEIFGHKLMSACPIDPTDESGVREVIVATGGIMLILGLSLDNQSQPTWIPSGVSGSWGLHAVWADEYVAGLYFATTWGGCQAIDRSYFSEGFVHAAYELDVRAI